MPKWKQRKKREANRKVRRLQILIGKSNLYRKLTSAFEDRWGGW